MDINNQTLVSNIVAKNYKAANIFKSYGIDFCCNGNRSIETVCDVNNVNKNTLIKQIVNCFKTETDTNDYKSWDIDFLSDYIYNKHHKYIENKTPEIKQYLDKLCSVHGEKHPELFEINTLFSESANDLTIHMKKEELILFPYFKKLALASRNSSTISSTQFDSVKSPIKMMHKEHDNEGLRFRKIAALSTNYTPPKDGCSTYKVTFSLLQEFEEDLHKHIHLENNILFKKGIDLEQTLQN
ncbi:iron-sulfur cluster repair di-iron protein [Tenacibaculum haliotis]|uniref:iron-sulfur cluster repair di-iron protein n=1 Tax=Tenacibaculum haliotis TaxID=1888914 RepID=UPI0021AF8740|nr:iron-sulfur cluster repair di-iron protein [Tenacibaculum haliotis]MCT4699912.1 iron-sulfur cluster repair di-iron protein [Tenacibaculum haliotis]